MPKAIATKAAFNDVIKQNPKVAVDFYADWCGPCKVIGPKFAAMENEFKDVTFVKINVDENEETSSEHKVSAMPTFMFFLNGEKCDELVGASEDKLKEKLTALAAK